jgi:hypothetical protein
MKTIADFLAGKIRRAEVEDRLSLSPAGAPHPSLGAHQGTLLSLLGSADFYADGMVIGASSIRYAEIDRVEIAEAGVVVSGAFGRVTIRSSPAGGVVLHATLRWIGNTILRRSIAD